MKVLGLYLKPRPGAEMLSVTSVDAVAGHGLRGDCHASAPSPRQVLIFSQLVLDELRLEPDAVRANVVVDGAVDDLPSGTVLRVGSSVALRLTLPCEACKKLEDIGRGLAGRLDGRRGTLARVVRGGSATIGDRVDPSIRGCRGLDNSWKRRLVEIVRSLPDGMFLSYTRLALLAGVQASYCRAFPRVLRRALEELGLTQAERVIPTSAAAHHDASRFWDGASYYRRDECVVGRRTGRGRASLPRAPRPA